jgi:hypothetical protein
MDSTHPALKHLTRSLLDSFDNANDKDTFIEVKQQTLQAQIDNIKHLEQLITSRPQLVKGVLEALANELKDNLEHL